MTPNTHSPPRDPKNTIQSGKFPASPRPILIMNSMTSSVRRKTSCACIVRKRIYLHRPVGQQHARMPPSPRDGAVVRSRHWQRRKWREKSRRHSYGSEGAAAESPSRCTSLSLAPRARVTAATAAGARASRTDEAGHRHDWWKYFPGMNDYDPTTWPSAAFCSVLYLF